MNQKEVDDIALDILTHLSIAENGSAAEAANSATIMCQNILKRYPKIRHSIFLWNQQSVLDELNLDYGNP